MTNNLRRARRLSVAFALAELRYCRCMSRSSALAVAAAIVLAPSIAPAPPPKHRMHTLRHLCKPDSQPCPKLMPDCSCSAGRLAPPLFPPEASP